MRSGLRSFFGLSRWHRAAESASPAWGEKLSGSKGRQKRRWHLGPSWAAASVVLSSARGEQQNPYRQDTPHQPPAQPFCKIGILMAIGAVESCPINTHRANALIDTDNCCLAAVGLRFAETDTLSDSDRWGAQAWPCPTLRSHAGLSPPPHTHTLPSKTAQQLPKVCESEMLHVNWLSKRFCHPLPSLRCLKMLTHCVWGTNVLLEVMEAFSLFLVFFFPSFFRISVHSSVTCLTCLLALPAHSQLLKPRLELIDFTTFHWTLF